MSIGCVLKMPRDSEAVQRAVLLYSKLQRGRIRLEAVQFSGEKVRGKVTERNLVDQKERNQEELELAITYLNGLKVAELAVLKAFPEG